MNFRRLCILIPSSLMFVLLPSLSSSDRSQHGQGFLTNPAETQLADGGGPVPPLPPKSFLNTLTDGGGPVPPLPPVFSSANSLAV